MRRFQGISSDKRRGVDRCPRPAPPGELPSSRMDAIFQRRTAYLPNQRQEGWHRVQAALGRVRTSLVTAMHRADGTTVHDRSRPINLIFSSEANPARAEYEIGRSPRTHGAAPHERRLCRLPRRYRGQPAETTRDSRDRRQPVDAQDPNGPHVPGGASARARAPALHAHLLVMAQPGRAVVCENRARLAGAGVFTSVADLARKIRRYIGHYNKAAKPVRWSYRNPAHRIGSTSASTVH